MNYSVNKKVTPTMFIFKQNSDNNSGTRSIDLFVRKYSSFVFLVSMKYFKDEQKSKNAVIQIFIKLNKFSEKLDAFDIKAWLYNETKNYCLKN